VRRRRAPLSHVSNETYSESNGTEDPRRLVSMAIAWRVSRKCLKRLAGSITHTHACTHTHTHTTILWLSGFCPGLPGEPIPEEAFTHSHLSWLSIVPYLLHPSNAIHDILSIQSTRLQSFSQYQVFFGIAPSTSHSIHFSPNHSLLFAACALTIATCFAVVPRLYWFACSADV